MSEYCYRVDGAAFYQGRCPSVEEAKLEAIRENELEGGSKIEIATVIPWTPTMDADHVLDQLACEADDEIGDPAEGWLSTVSGLEKDDLSERLTKVLRAWLKKHKLEPNFYTIGESKQTVVGEQ
jgi:hypothetical protein